MYKLYLGGFMKIEDAIKDFINFCIFEKGLSDKTKLSYENDLKLYLEFLHDRNIYDVVYINSDDIKDLAKSAGNNVGEIASGDVIVDVYTEKKQLKNKQRTTAGFLENL